MLTGLSYCSTGEKRFASLFSWSGSVTALTWGRCRNMNETSLMYPFPKVCPFCSLSHSTFETSSRPCKGGHRGTVVFQRQTSPQCGCPQLPLFWCPCSSSPCLSLLPSFLPPLKEQLPHMQQQPMPCFLSPFHAFRTSLLPSSLELTGADSVMGACAQQSVVTEHTEALLKPQRDFLVFWCKVYIVYPCWCWPWSSSSGAQPEMRLE